MATPGLALLLAAGLAADPGSWALRYRVRFVPSPAPRYDALVEADLLWSGAEGARPEVVELGMAHGYAEAFGPFVQDFKARLPPGGRAPHGGYRAEVLSPAEGRFALPVLPDGRAGFRYRVPLEHDPSASAGWDETPHAFQDGTLWNGRALFITPASGTVELRFLVPDGVRVSHSFEAIGPEDLHVPDVRLLRDCYLLVGNHREREVAVRDSVFVVAVDGAVADAAAVIEDQLRSVVEAGAKALGGSPPRRCLVAVTHSAEEGGGAGIGHGVHVLVSEPPRADGPEGWRRIFAHELCHLWTPTVVGFDSREMWFSEGFTEYYAHRLLRETGGLSDQAFADGIRRWAEAYLGEAGAVGLREAGKLGAKNRTLVYQGGALAALCLDVAIRDGSGGVHSLDDVMAELYARCAATPGRRVPVSELEGLLARYGGESLGAFLERHVAGSELLPLAATFQAAGMEFERTTSTLLEGLAIARLLQCNGMTVSAGGIVINRTHGDGLRADDLLVEVRGEPVADFGDLGRILAGAGPGDAVKAVVTRDGQRVELSLTLGGVGEELPTRDLHFITLRPSASAEPPARATRSAIFGELR